METTETPLQGRAVRPVPTRVAQPRLNLVHPTRAYSVTGNPFAVSAILPLLLATFLGVELAVVFNADPVVTSGALMIVAMGLLLIPAVAMRGNITLSHEGISFVRGKHHLTADWNHVAGLVAHADSGVCIEILKPEMDVARIKGPGGLRADRGDRAYIPLRYFGDRRYSILYDIRERLPEQRWKDVLSRASERGTTRIQIVYGLTVAICGLALFATMYAVTH